MIKNNSFVVGATYALRADSVNSFTFTRFIKEHVSNGMRQFEFTPTRVSIDGAAYVDGHLIAMPSEFHKFTQVSSIPFEMELEPFQQNCTYQLLPEWVDKFKWNDQIINEFGYGSFKFTAKVMGMFGVLFPNERGYIALHSERPMFKKCILEI